MASESVTKTEEAKRKTAYVNEETFIHSTPLHIFPTMLAAFIQKIKVQK